MIDGLSLGWANQYPIRGSLTLDTPTQLCKAAALLSPS